MSKRTRHLERGFTLIEISVVILIVGAIVAIAVPRITNAMREYRLNIAMRQFADLVQRVKTQAVSDNLRSGLAIDTGGRRLGLVHYLVDGTVDRIDYVPMPQGISFAVPGNITAPVTGAPTTAAVSFPPYGTSTTVFVQNFNSRGFPIVAAGAINAVYMTNGNTFRAVTVNSVSGVRKWSWSAVNDSDGHWTDA
jgi:prepilin-type N-terminal cleavage/methylation domain-containing protein